MFRSEWQYGARQISQDPNQMPVLVDQSAGCGKSRPVVRFMRHFFETQKPIAAICH
jgi:hypothetical protein